MSGLYVEFDMVNEFSEDFDFINFIKNRNDLKKSCHFTANRKEFVTTEFLKNPYFNFEDLLKNNSFFSDSKIKQVKNLKSSKLLRIRKSALSRSFFIYHLSEADINFLKSGQKIYDALSEVEKQIQNSIPESLIIKQKKLEKEKRAFFK